MGDWLAATQSGAEKAEAIATFVREPAVCTWETPAIPSRLSATAERIREIGNRKPEAILSF